MEVSQSTQILCFPPLYIHTPLLLLSLWSPSLQGRAQPQSGALLLLSLTVTSVHQRAPCLQLHMISVIQEPGPGATSADAKQEGSDQKAARHLWGRVGLLSAHLQPSAVRITGLELNPGELGHCALLSARCEEG